jgi:hypothetical protein
LGYWAISGSIHNLTRKNAHQALNMDQIKSDLADMRKENTAMAARLA